eukprot:GHVN01051056.1.p1 GENE.GHVN01051056.1~~GHVN01051056.1.p1  ORF type:complete len:290 (+),score=37.67 GHVN01051056.1:757-1626(+)
MSDVGSQEDQQPVDEGNENIDTNVATPPTSLAPKASQYDPTLLKFYYDRMFPFDLITSWLTYGQDKIFAKREFSLSMMKGSEEIYMRWQSFKSAAAFKQRFLELETCPHKMDVGAVYSHPVNEKESYSGLFRPVSKEIVFDIDMNDYDEIRTCCKGKVICYRCWRFMTLAMELLDTALREDFGFTQLLWVFSGRRGLHCWVCDPTARELPSEARTAVAEYLNLVTGSANQKKKVNLYSRAIHPSAKRAHNIALPYFDDLVVEQGHFCSLCRLFRQRKDPLGIHHTIPTR